VTVIPNGIPLDAPAADSVGLRARLGVGPTVPLVGTVSRLVRQKGPEDFVRASVLIARRVPAAHFVLVGAGPRQRQLDRALRRAGLGRRFHQPPFLPGVSASLGELDVFVLASRFEGGPYTPLEAMRAGTPVVLTDVVGNRDVVEHRVSGLLVPAADPDALAAAVVELLLDPELGASLASAARIRVREAFDVAEQGRALSALYQQLARP
jgi:glycosyltransferase involved in cell wall biosynthesis